MKEAQELALIVLMYSGAFFAVGMTLAEFLRMYMVKSVLEAFMSKVEVKQVDAAPV